MAYSKGSLQLPTSIRRRVTQQSIAVDCDRRRTGLMGLSRNRPAASLDGNWETEDLSESVWIRLHRRRAQKCGVERSDRLVAVCDGLYDCNITGPIHLLNLDDTAHWPSEKYARQVQAARTSGKISCVTVIPGYDDTQPGRTPLPSPTTKRENGKTYPHSGKLQSEQYRIGC